MKPLPTYENDKDLEPLIYTTLTDEKLMDFFYKKGKVNVNNLSYCVHEYGNKRQIAQHIVSLETSGMIKPINSHMYKVTGKAKWIRFYSHSTWQFWSAIAGILAMLISIIAIWISCR